MKHEEGGGAMRSHPATGVDGAMAHPPPRPAAARDAAGRIAVRIGHGRGELLALEAAWRALLATLPRPLFIHAFEWQRAYLECLASDPEATCYVSLFDGPRAVAIFPLRRVRRRVNGIPLRLWELPTHPHLALGDPLLSPEWEPALLVRLLVQALERAADRPWDALRLPNLPDDSLAVRGRLDEALPRTHRGRTGGSMHFDCSGLEAALANCSSGFARNLRRQARKLGQQGTVTMTLARHGDELDAAFADFLRLEASGWKGAAGRLSAIALHPRLLDFYLALKNRFAANDACLIPLLKLDGKVIAAQFCLRAGDTLCLQKIAYDEAWRAEAPGNQLLYRLLEHCCRDPGIRRLSLVTGPAWAVGRWNPESRPVWELLVFRRGLRGVCGLALRRLRDWLWTPARARWRRSRAGGGNGAQPAARPDAAG